MDLIIQSNHDQLLKLKFVAVWKATMVEIAGDISHRDIDLTDVETVVAAAILSMAATGQTSPGQLQRHAVSEAKSRVLRDRADRLHLKTISLKQANQ